MFKDEVFEKWFPLATSIDLIEGLLTTVSAALLSDLKRILSDQEVVTEIKQFNSFDEIFSSNTIFTGVPTIFYLIPTKTKWVAMWNNTYSCDGYSSLCYNLTRLYNLPTLHWKSHDKDAYFQAGTVFTYHEMRDNTLFDRSIYCAKDGNTWKFYEQGKPLLGEDINQYKNKKKKDRLNEQKLMELLNKLGADPWKESFYDFSKPVHIFRRINYPDSIDEKDFQYIKNRISRMAE